ncbi:MAG: hypothetical protein A2Y04_02450 [Omnitrophica WOR_2 bacterium GWC2_45_7]|nr:MAG: hypothetical protein A2Y04_02450 [Omnitrophica WOR_2 bacterium GWC2_45_7]
MSVAKVAGWQVEALLIHFREEYTQAVRKAIEFQPDVIGFTTVSSQYHFVKELAVLFKKALPRTVIVCGGVHMTINKDSLLEAEAIDAGFVGESEGSFKDFLSRLEKGQEWRDVDNLAYVRRGRVHLNPLRPLMEDLDILTPPDRDNVFFETTLKKVGYASFFFSRGCPFLCSYCSNRAIAAQYGLHRNAARYRSVNSSIEEIERVVARYRLDKVAISDDIFGIDKVWRKEFCEQYRKRIGIRFFCLLRANIIDDEFARLLKHAGCFKVSIGLESGNEYVRNKIMNRSMSQGQIIKAFDVLRKHGIQTNALNIIGVPGETDSMLWDTIRLNRRVRPTTSGVNIFYPYKGTELGDYCFKNKLVDEELFESFSNERRGSVLLYPPEQKARLEYYCVNWEKLIYKWDFAHWVRVWGKKILEKLKLLSFLRKCRTYFSRRNRQNLRDLGPSVARI